MSEPQIEVEEKEWVDITEDENGGILKKILQEGTGFQTPEHNSEVEVHYVGTLEDGTKFDSSRDRSDKFKFNIGVGSVIKGWDQGVKTMKKGEKALFKIRGDYAYGERGSPPKIPPNATLIFEIELFNWVSEKDITDKKDGGVLKKTLKNVEGWEQPNEGSTVKVQYRVLNDAGEATATGEVSFIVGDEQTFDGLEIATKKLKKGELAFFKIRSDYIFSGDGNNDLAKGPIVAPNTNLDIEIELVELQKEKESYQYNSNAEKIEVSRAKKDEGNEFFKQGRYNLANKRYKRALNFIQYGDWKDDKQEVDQLKVSIHLNIAAIHLKEKDYRNVISEVKNVLDIEPSNVKALYRRSVALSSTGEFIEALADLNKAISVDPSNPEVKREILRVKKLQREQDDKDKNLYSKMLQGL